jgi:hypothetical protein
VNRARPPTHWIGHSCSHRVCTRVRISSVV